MIIKKIPLRDQTLLSASVCINNYKRAVEELVYNSLDAESTSIAVRVNIEENFIQILDNGSGIENPNFTLLGRKYSTSKFIDITTLKSAPDKYGFRGLSLASLIEISQAVKISSKVINSNETWIKNFYKSKEKNISLHTNRPSKGTTVEIIGFLYNLSIQKKNTEPVKEMQNIKLFLQQLSLVHNNVSISLRDDCRNEIVFTINKNRDAYQTLRSLFNIQHNDIQDLQVEKKQYKVRGFIGKNKESTKKYQWIYLNGKIINKTVLHKKINTMFSKMSNMNSHGNNKNKNVPEDESYLFNNNLPHYFIFISCPNLDFDIIYKNNETIVEFKNWTEVEKLLEKLIKFYFGKLNLKPTNKNQEANIQHNKKSNDTRKKVKDIMERFLNNHAYKPRIFQFKNGVKGKNVKRKKEPKTKLQDITNKNNIVSKINLLKKAVDLTKIIDRKNKKTPICKDNHVGQSNIIKKHLNKKKKNNFNGITDNQYNTPLSLHKGQDAVINMHRGTLCKQKAKVLKYKKYDKPEEYKKYKNDYLQREYIYKDTMKQNYIIRNNNQYMNNSEVKTTYDLLNPAEIIHSFRPLEENQQIFIHQQTQSYVATCETYLPKATFDSHNYYKEIGLRKNVIKKFISSNSCNNFLLHKNKVMYEPSYLKKIKSTSSNKFLNHPKFISPYMNEMQKNNKQSTICNIIETSNTRSIDFDRKYISQNVVNEKRYSIDINFENTYTIDMQSSSLFTYNNNYNKTYSLQTCDNLSFRNKSLRSLTLLTQNETSNSNVEEKLNKNIIVSESQSLEPLNFCETVFQSDKLYRVEEINTSFLNNDEVEGIKELELSNKAIVEEINNGKSNDEPNEYNGIIFDIDVSDQIVTQISKDQKNINKQNIVQEQIVQGTAKSDSNTIDYNNLNNFELKSRHHFVPKGMSQIFKNNYKMACALDNVQEYYADDVYKKFANDILKNYKIYEPDIGNVKDVVSKDLKKVNNKLNKDNADLIFDCHSLKNAEVLGQVDAKFILAIVKGRTFECGTSLNFLALFDQHAVDERVRLESNLIDYLNDNEWASVTIDSVIKLKLNQEDYFYVYNHKEKFYQFGLRWTFEDNEIYVHAIPAAILGKNIREVEVVMKAVKSLISELVDIIKVLRGNVSSYPKSIMNLICSEACRYAIKFGDKLSKNNCVNLINNLSKCKTPFQCAHGRPVMAILMELTNNKTSYTVNLNKIKGFKTMTTL